MPELRPIPLRLSGVWEVNEENQISRAERNQGDAPTVSLVIPVFNEAECIAVVLEEAIGALERTALTFEALVIDDGSTDKTGETLARLKTKFSALRVFTLSPNSGQSAAFGVGFQNCRGRIVALMDGDGQNDPRDIPMLLDALKEHDACCGYRAARRDTLSKRMGSRIANAARQFILRDGIKDTGCSLKAIKTEFLRDLPMTLRGMHRFLPALLMMRGARITQVPVNHRPRAGGRSKYTNFERLLETIWDLWAVRWMQKRYRRFSVMKVE